MSDNSSSSITYTGGHGFSGPSRIASILEFGDLSFSNHATTAGTNASVELAAAPGAGKTINVWGFMIDFNGTAPSTRSAHRLHSAGHTKILHQGAMSSNGTAGASDISLLDMPISVGENLALQYSAELNGTGKTFVINVFYTVDNV